MPMLSAKNECAPQNLVGLCPLGANLSPVLGILLDFESQFERKVEFWQLHSALHMPFHGKAYVFWQLWTDTRRGSVHKAKVSSFSMLKME